jgi:hypothetical protein
MCPQHSIWCVHNTAFDVSTTQYFMCPQHSIWCVHNTAPSNVLHIPVFPHYATVDSGRKVLLLLREAGMSGVLFHDAVKYYYCIPSYIAEDATACFLT